MVEEEGSTENVLGSIKMLEKLYCHVTKLVYGQYIMCSDLLMCIDVTQNIHVKVSSLGTTSQQILDDIC